MFQLDLTGKRAWVTGASRGIGKATAVALAEAGCDVAVGYLHSEAGAMEAAERVRALGRKVVTVRGDIARAEECERMAGEIQRAIGGVDVLVNNAALHRNNLFLLLEAREWEEVLGANLMGTVNVTRAALKGMWARKWGRIINFSSVATSGGGRGQANYVASKGAVEALSRNLAVEFAPRNINVNCIAPGAIETEMWEDPSKKEAVVARQLVRRVGTPDEIAGWVVFLASRYGDFLTGEVLNVNGGWQRGWDVSGRS